MNESEQNESGRDDDGTDQSDSSSSTTDMDSDVELDRGGLEEIIRLVRGDMSGEIPTRTRRIAQETLLNILRQRSISGLVSNQSSIDVKVYPMTGELFWETLKSKF